MFDHEKLDVYRIHLEFLAWSSILQDELVESGAVKSREIRDHLDRAGLSVLFNTAEGNGKRQAKSRAKFFDIARGSATECAACLDALVAKQMISKDRAMEGKGLLLRVVSMLTKLIQRYEG